jgi:hypothetical protein
MNRVAPSVSAIWCAGEHWHRIALSRRLLDMLREVCYLAAKPLSKNYLTGDILKRHKEP